MTRLLAIYVTIITITSMSSSPSIVSKGPHLDINQRGVLSGRKLEDFPDKIINPLPSDRERTATGGFVHTVLVLLSLVAFLGNGAFMIFVFWM